ncbi:TPA: hypothetical protein L9493_001011 [Klebsiella variicola subsp. variicola]|nr:hypothetical protein [Klebsiella variicola subsp. variicola]HBS3663200.1 hypothetical protein [Klebsiella variicola subsp. variicola]
MSSQNYHTEDEITVCTYVDDNNRTFIFSVNTVDYGSADEAQQAALSLAKAASETYQE